MSASVAPSARPAARIDSTGFRRGLYAEVFRGQDPLLRVGLHRTRRLGGTFGLFAATCAAQTFGVVPLNEDGCTFGIVQALACKFLGVAASVIDEAPIPTVVGELADVLHPHAAESANDCKMVSRLDRHLRCDLAPDYVEPLRERVNPTGMQRRDYRRELVHSEHQVDLVGHDVWLVWRTGLLFIAGHEGRIMQPTDAASGKRR